MSHTATNHTLIPEPATTHAEGEESPNAEEDRKGDLDDGCPRTGGADLIAIAIQRHSAATKAHFRQLPDTAMSTDDYLRCK